VDGNRIADIAPVLRANLSREAKLMTDEHQFYKEVGRDFASHESVTHSKDEYVRGEVHTNTVEGYNSIFKRDTKGVYQHCTEKHLHRYLSEFDFVIQTAWRLASTMETCGRWHRGCSWQASDVT
jgi:hypothetical protein